MPHHPLYNFFITSNVNLPSFSLKLFPIILSLSAVFNKIHTPRKDKPSLTVYIEAEPLFLGLLPHSKKVFPVKMKQYLSNSKQAHLPSLGHISQPCFEIQVPRGSQEAYCPGTQALFPPSADFLQGSDWTPHIQPFDPSSKSPVPPSHCIPIITSNATIH